MDRRLFLGASIAALTASTPLLAQSRPAPAGKGDAALRTLMDAFWDEELSLMPETATQLGLDTGRHADARSRLNDYSAAGRLRWIESRRDRLKRMAAIPEADLSPAWRVNRQVVAYAYDQAVDGGTRFRFGEPGTGYAPYSPYVVSQLTGAYASVPDFLASVHPVKNAQDAEAYLQRLSAFDGALDANSTTLRADAAAGVLAPDFAVDAALAQLKALRGSPAASNGLVTALVEKAKAAGIAGDWSARATRIVEQEVYPALDRQIAALTALRPKAKAEPGIWTIPDGDAFYAGALAFQTTTTLSPDEVHRLGLEQVAALDAQLDPLLSAQGLTQGSVGARLTELSRRPDQLYPNTDAGRAELLAALVEQVAAIRPKMPQVFATLPKSPVEIVRVPPEIQDGAPNGYATSPALDGSRPGRFYINLKDTAEWPKFTLPSLTYHEALPGHQWEGAIALSSTDTPILRRAGLYFAAYGEGWALYAEQLADELGAYEGDPIGRIGFLQSLQFRAVRMVVDTGMHAKRWSRAKATDYMVETTGFARGRAQREIDRYAVWPGQACSYKVGHTEWVRLRDAAKARAGAAFDIKRFHDVLRQGSMPITVLTQQIEALFPAG
ncbi:DUF885 domain-containing protein [Sphingomonas sp. Y38-1Y]|uniref:DUF885 domain-containing protein n=1 Tax=Sphingomonas sp. Y38-1Y TaxID=3078265 RepID=UPI0028E863F4|nr:DUF885 family protein [Sphingomonas sp. Y38-1Y]